MRNKRLLAILIVFIIIATTAILGGVVFTVKHINIEFTNDTAALAGLEDSIEKEVRDSLPFVMGNNIFLSINEQRIRNTIHDNPELLLIRVTNVEAHFPNKLVIRVRERYPVYFYQNGSDIAILDGELRIISKSRPEKGLVEISSKQIETEPYDNGYLEVGKYLDDYLPRNENGERDTLRTQILKDIVSWFRLPPRQNNEDAIRELFEAIKFTRIFSVHTGKSEFTVLLRQPPQQDDINNYHIVRIEAAEYRFIDKLHKVWDGVTEIGPDTTGTHWVYDDASKTDSIGYAFSENTVDIWRDAADI